MFDSIPNTAATGAVAGAAISPLNTGERKAFHYIENIFDPDKHPPEDLTKYVVPQENELIFDVTNGVVYRAAYVDWQGTLKTKMVPWVFTNSNGDATSEQDWIYGLRGGPLAGEALLSVDYSVRPNVARVDSTIMRPGAAYAKVFLGNDASENGKIISAQYDLSANMTSNKVPCKLAEIVDRTNVSIMTTGSFSVTENAEALPDGTRCWLVFYDEGGNFIPPAQPLMVQHSAYMRDHQIGIKYVKEIELVAPWFTNTMSPERLMVPTNVSITAVEFLAVVHYSDGSVSDPFPVNGERFSLYGLNEYRPTWPGQEAEVTLVYKLQPNEQHYLSQPGNPDFKSKVYYVESAAVKGAYSPKIYTFPQWDATIRGYRLQHWLYDLDRKAAVDVSALVKFNDKSEPWRPSAYGVSQNLIFNLNMRDVSALYESVIFVQHTTIVLYKDSITAGKRWDVSFSYDKPFYGAQFATVVNNGANTTFNVSNGYATQAAWLQGLYRAVEPSFNRFDEEEAPNPTHFYMVHEDGRKWLYSIEDWNKTNVIPLELQRGKTWYLRWVVRDSAGKELQLGSTGVVVEF